MYKKYLENFQLPAYDYCITHDSCGLLPVEMRAGKTYITIASLLYRIKNSYSCFKKVLIVCPYSAFFGWEDALVNHFKCCSKEDIVYLTGTRGERLENLEKSYYSKKTWYIINKEGFLILPEIKNLGLIALILDESRCISNPKSAISKFFTINFRNVKYKYALSGLPNPENNLEWFQQLKFLFDTVLNCKNYYEFRLKYFKLNGYNWKITDKGKEELSKFIAKNCFQLYRKDIKQFYDKKVYKVYSCEKPKKLIKIENEIKRLMILYDKDDIEIKSGSFSIEAFTWLRLLTGGYYENRLWFIDKLSLLEEVIENEYKNSKIIIWAVFREEIQAISNYLEIPFINGSIEPEERNLIVNDFKLDKINKIVIQPECFKYGQNLSEADAEIYYSSPFSYETRMQTEDRLIDIKNKKSKDIIDLIMRDSIDEEILQKLKTKESNISFFKRLVKKYETRNYN